MARYIPLGIILALAASILCGCLTGGLYGGTPADGTTDTNGTDGSDTSNGAGDGSSDTGAGNGDGSLDTTSVVTVLMVSGNAFSPQTATARAGQTVRWRNDDALPHTATSDIAGRFDSGTLGTDETFDFQVPSDTTSGTQIFYHCRLHGTGGGGANLGQGMAGVISVL